MTRQALAYCLQTTQIAKDCHDEACTDTNVLKLNSCHQSNQSAQRGQEKDLHTSGGPEGYTMQKILVGIPT